MMNKPIIIDEIVFCLLKQKCVEFVEISKDRFNGLVIFIQKYFHLLEKLYVSEWKNVFKNFQKPS